MKFMLYDDTFSLCVYSRVWLFWSDQDLGDIFQLLPLSFVLNLFNNLEYGCIGEKDFGIGCVFKIS